MKKVDRDTDDGTTRHVFSEITAALFFFMILFVFVQQTKIIEVFERMKVKTLQNYIKDQIDASFESSNCNNGKPTIIVDPNNPLIQRIIMTNDVLKFNTGEKGLSNNDPCDRTILRLVGSILKKYNTIYESIEIEGHADTVPMKSEEFPTNWELSTGRATTVVRYLTDSVNFPAKKISAIGFSSYHPIDNKKIELNRRIEMVIRYSYAKSTMQSDSAKAIYNRAKEKSDTVQKSSF